MSLTARIYNETASIDVGAVTTDAQGTGRKWALTEELDGWDSAEVQQQMIELQAKHGVAIPSIYLRQRAVVLGGVCKATGEDDFYDAWDYLMGIATDFTGFNLQVTEGAKQRFCIVKLGGRAKRSRAGVNSFQFSLPLVAEDPRKYNVSQSSQAFTSGQTLTLVNAGNFETWPSIQCSSASGAVVITHNGLGRSIILADTGSPLILPGTAEVINGVTDRYSQLDPATRWFPLVPGNNSITVTGCSATFTWRSAWV